MKETESEEIPLDSVYFIISFASSKPTLPADSDDEKFVTSNLRSALDTSLILP